VLSEWWPQSPAISPALTGGAFSYVREQ